MAVGAYRPQLSDRSGLESADEIYRVLVDQVEQTEVNWRIRSHLRSFGYLDLDQVDDEIVRIWIFDWLIFSDNSNRYHVRQRTDITF